MNTDPKHISQEELEAIERYLRGEMSEGHRSAFEKRMNEDEDFNQSVLEYQQLIEGIKKASLQNKLNEFHAEIEQESSTHDQGGLPETENDRPFLKYLVAASLLLAIGLTIWFAVFQQTPEEELFATYFEPDPGLITPMSSTEEYEFYSGMIEYKQENYQSAINRWQPLIAENPESDTLTYFLGVAHLALGDQKEAQSYLEVNLETDDNSFRNEAYYYLGLAYLKSGNRSVASDALSQSDDQRAIQLLNELNLRE